MKGQLIHPIQTLFHQTSWTLIIKGKGRNFSWPSCHLSQQHAIPDCTLFYCTGHFLSLAPQPKTAAAPARLVRTCNPEQEAKRSSRCFLWAGKGWDTSSVSFNRRTGSFEAQVIDLLQTVTDICPARCCPLQPGWVLGAGVGSSGLQGSAGRSRRGFGAPWCGCPTRGDRGAGSTLRVVLQLMAQWGFSAERLPAAAASF